MIDMVDTGNAVGERLKRWLLPLGMQLIIVTPFFAMSALQPAVSNFLVREHYDSTLINSLPGAFFRYLCALLVAAIVLVASFIADRFRRTDGPSIKELITYGALSFFLYFLLLSRCLQFPIGGDDVYIDYRYVSNFVNGLGLDYNPGQHVMGITSQLHFWLLVAASTIFRNHDIAVISQMVNTVLQCAVYLTIFVVLRENLRSPALGLVGAIIYSLSPYEMGEVVYGKESSLVTFLMLFSIWAFNRDRLQLVTWLAALLLLTRPEAVFWMLIVMVATWRRRNWSACRLWIGPIALIAAWYLCLFLYAGSVVPQGGFAKARVYHPCPTVLGLIECVTFLGRSVVDNPIHPLDPLMIFPVLPVKEPLLWLLVGSMVLAALGLFSRKQRWLTLYFAGVVAMVIFFSTFSPYLFHWYFSWFSLVPVFLVPMIVRELVQVTRRHRAILFRPIACGIIAYLLAVPVLQQPKMGKDIPLPIFFWPAAQERLLVYARWAEYLNQLPPPRPLVATSEIGMFGYSYHGPILDLGGLVSPQVVRYYPVAPEQRVRDSNYTIPPQAINDLKPDFVILYEPNALNSLLKDRKFLGNYRLERSWQLALWGSKGWYLYKRRDLEGNAGNNMPGTSQEIFEKL